MNKNGMSQIKKRFQRISDQDVVDLRFLFVQEADQRKIKIMSF